MGSKKTLYQVLDIPANATDQEILAAHAQKLQQLEASAGRLSREDFDFRAKLLNMALETLSDPVLRLAYDEKLMSRTGGRQGSRALVPATDPDALVRRADALALRAEALALRADAMSMRTDLVTIDEDLPPPSRFARLWAQVKSPLKAAFVGIGIFAAVGMVAQMTLVYFAASRMDGRTSAAAAAAAAAEEKVLIQEYYQTHGVRPASAAEVRLLEQENRRKEEAEREERAAEREQQRIENQARRDQDEARALAERVSEDLRRAEAQAAREAEWKRIEREREDQRREDEERRRALEAQEKWRNASMR